VMLPGEIIGLLLGGSTARCEDRSLHRLPGLADADEAKFLDGHGG
jgi:hypothetical protein